MKQFLLRIISKLSPKEPTVTYWAIFDGHGKSISVDAPDLLTAIRLAQSSSTWRLHTIHETDKAKLNPRLHLPYPVDGATWKDIHYPTGPLHAAINPTTMLDKIWWKIL
jgi:hypothetical protein